MKKFITGVAASIMLAQLVFTGAAFAAVHEPIRTYFDCDFGEDFAVSGTTIQQNGSKVFDLYGTNAATNIKVADGVLNMDFQGKTAISNPPLRTRYYFTKSSGAENANGADSGIITTEADIKIGNWSMNQLVCVHFLSAYSWDNQHDFIIRPNSGNVMIEYTDKDGSKKAFDTDLDWEVHNDGTGDDNKSKHIKISIYPEANIVETEIDGKKFVIDDIRNIAVAQYLDYYAGPYGIIVDNAKCYKESLGAYLSMTDISTINTTKIGEGEVSIYRSLDGTAFYKAADSDTYQVERVPYTQYFKAVITDAAGSEESPVKKVDPYTTAAVKRTYYDCDFGADFTVVGTTIQQNGSKVFDLYGTNAATNIKVEDGVLNMDYQGKTAISNPPLRTRYYFTKSAGAENANGADSGIITTEADVKIGNWSMSQIICLNLVPSYNLSEGYNFIIRTASGKIMIDYTDKDGASKTLDTGLTWSTPNDIAANKSKHLKISVDIENNSVTADIDGSSFVISDIKDICLIQYIDYYAGPYGIIVDNAVCIKTDEVPIETSFNYAEKLYFAASDADNSLESGTAVTVAYTNDGEAREYTLIAAAYAENGALAETVVMPVSLIDGTGKAYTAYFAGEYPRERINVYLWNTENLRAAFNKASFGN